MIDVTTEELLTLLLSIWLPLLRITGVMFMAPLLGDGSVPVQIRVLLSVLLTVLIAPLVTVPTHIDPFSLEMLRVSLVELIWGMSYGLLFQIFFAVFSMVGQAISLQMGLGMAVMNDPANGVNVAILGRLFHIACMLLFLAMDGHIAVVMLLRESFDVWPIGEGIGEGGFKVILELSAWMFVSAMTIVLPAVTIMLVSNITFGFMSRVAPSFNIFALGFPMTMLLGLFAFFISISNAGSYYNELLFTLLAQVRLFIQGG
ncbi:flagellar biosynthetic protein FliR [Vibrio sp.]|nr:flagellar biosynthetic protein FliR [Vibrio sp.]